MVFEMEDCGGCRTCELACGYHHTGVFNPSKSSLRVINRSDDKPGFLIYIQLDNEDNIIGCDGCNDLKQPMCIKYCHKDDVLLTMIQAVLSEKTLQSNKLFK